MSTSIADGATIEYQYVNVSDTYICLLAIISTVAVNAYSNTIMLIRSAISTLLPFIILYM